jgi:hypothetical protein
MEKYTLEEHQQYVEEQQRKAKEAEQARREQVEKETARRAWVADGGDEEGFQQYWPLLRDEGRAERTKNADRQAREVQRLRTRRVF